VTRKNIMQWIIADSEGMVVESYGRIYDPEILSAIFSPLRKLLENIIENLRIKEFEEICLIPEGSQFKIHLHFFSVNNIKFFLILIGSKNLYFQDFMNSLTLNFKKKINGLEIENDLSEISIKYEEKCFQKRIFSLSIDDFIEKISHDISDIEISKIFVHFIKKLIKKEIKEIYNNQIIKEGNYGEENTHNRF